MKWHFSSVAFGSLGFVSGFVVCFFCFVFRASPKPTAMVLPVSVLSVADHDSDDLELRPYLIQPTYPPKIVGTM